MERIGDNFKVVSAGSIEELGRVTLHEQLSLTGSEISVNELPAGVTVPFVHAHRQNEEVYIILNGKGTFYVDGDEFAVEAGDVVRIDPAGARCITASPEDSIRFICIQTAANSLVQFTQDDGVPVEVKPSWFK
ncbi:cupin domain-containing protein [Geomonas subterranea]|uniref:Cupin domain-containing protein n=1 Tax=Geomonas subterranea TaxID=2847989 RepID=A0ABX8LPY1_9BACT|nr:MULTISPECIES: cupin domain-containing protein [Geomonas]QXE92770.1 cupin domain-containing protein [Geomonas subterranea]QXM09126.1 cupin domain-containing protein [Geomonas subterranea]